MQQKHAQTEPQENLPQPASEEQVNSASPVLAERQLNKWAVMGTLAIGIFMATLDTSIVNVTLRCYRVSPYPHTLYRLDLQPVSGSKTA